jgi:hypothetical protein
MHYAVLICSDESCAEESEAWGELEDFDRLACEGCGCLLQVLSLAEEADSFRLLQLPRRAAPARLRRAA